MPATWQVGLRPTCMQHADWYVADSPGNDVHMQCFNLFDADHGGSIGGEACMGVQEAALAARL